MLGFITIDKNKRFPTMEDLRILLLFIPLTLIAYKLLFQWRRHANLPPSAPSLPIIGHLHLLRKPLHRTLASLSEKYGPIMFLRLGYRPAILVSSLPLAEECFTKNDIVLANRPRLLLGKIVLFNMETILNAPYGDQWRNLRRIGANDIFSQHRLDASSSIRRDEILLMLKKLSSNSLRGFAEVEMKSVFSELAFNMTMRMISGIRFYSEARGDADEAVEFRELIKEIVKYGQASYPGDYLPILQLIDFQGLKKRTRRIASRTGKLLQGMIDEKRRNKSWLEGSSCSTLIDHLLSLQESQPECYTDEMIKGYSLSLLIAGTDTSSITLEWALSNLLSHPDALEKAREEIDSQIGQDRLIGESDVPAMAYIHSIILETLRLYPPVPFLLPHYSSREFTVGGYTVPSDTTVLVNVWAIHRDPGIWPDDPGSFKPERFGNGDVTSKLMLPFGMGRRACPGAQLAQRVVGLALGSLIQCFDWKRLDDEDVDMEEGEGVTMPKAKPLEVMCRARRPIIDMVLSESPLV